MPPVCVCVCVGDCINLRVIYFVDEEEVRQKAVTQMAQRSM